MDNIVYLLLGLAVLAPVAVIFMVRQDLRRLILRSGVAGGIAGLVSELFYLRDYWHPIGIFGSSNTVIEDFVFGFAITSLSATAYLAVRREALKRVLGSRRRTLLGMLVISLLVLCVLNLGLGVASIAVSSLIFVACAAFIGVYRRDLIRVGVVSAALVVGYIFLVYIMLFTVLAPNWWQAVWLLDGTVYDRWLFGSFPATEILWYACWVMVGSICYPYMAGAKLSAPKAVGRK